MKNTKRNLIISKPGKQALVGTGIVIFILFFGCRAENQALKTSKSPPLKNESKTAKITQLLKSPQKKPVSILHRIRKSTDLPLKMRSAATIKQSWVAPLNKSTFNEASRAHILIYASVIVDTLQKYTLSLSETAFLKQQITVMKLNYETTRSNTSSTYIGLENDLDTALIKTSFKHISAWQKQAYIFYQDYLYEQRRLAYLFPKITSEIGRLEPKENLGDMLPDKTFELTFDDGPSSPPSLTQNVIQELTQANLTATFFLLGKNVRNVPQTHLKALYRGMTVGTHSEQHVSHQDINGALAQSYVLSSKQVIEKNTGQYVLLFRPPYGQRTHSLSKFCHTQGLQIKLWNIDSQDWQSSMTENLIVQRILSLMLLKRHGIILLHDIHPKTSHVVRILTEKIRIMGVQIK